MKRTAYIWIGCLAFFFWAVLAHGLEVPELKGRVNDYAGMLSSAAKNQIEAILRDLEQTDSTQIAVLTVLSLEGGNIEEYAIRVAESWKIGQKGMDNGAILVISKNDRALRIEVGYGLEGTLTDLVAGRIIRNIIVPRFQEGHFDQGVTEGVQAMIQVARGEFSAAAEHPSSPDAGQWESNPFLIIAFLFIVNMMGRIRRLLGAISGAILLPVLAALLFSPGLFGALLMIPIGAVAGLIMSIFGSPLNFHPSSDRTRHGGGFRLGGGGGFGGFSGGGGSFGGGGASGRW